jgi:hypothetical protein
VASLDKDQLKLEADRLSKDPVLIEAIARIRLGAMEGLIKVDPAKTNEIIALQERVKVCDAFTTTLKAMINSAQEKRTVKPV